MQSPRLLCHILVVCLAALTWAPRPTEAARILGLFANPSESHFSVMRSLMGELARREHNVTVYTSHRLNDRIENFKEFVVEPEYPFWLELQKATNSLGDLYKMSQLSEATLLKALTAVGTAATDHFMQNEAVQKLLQLPLGEAKAEYDILIVDLFYSEALVAFGHLQNIPTIGVISSNFQGYMENFVDGIVPVACSPINFRTHVADMGFWDRLAAIKECKRRRQNFATLNEESQENLIKKHFGHLKVNLPSVTDLHTSLGVILLNNHVPLWAPRPMLSNTILAGGMQITRPRELPWHIRRFLDETRGAIYMNLGDEQMCADIPKDRLQVLFNVLGKYKERVLWTCHDVQKIDGLPKNFMIQHSVPQSDILAHPHVKVFLMNGDLLGVQEGIVRHVPMIGIPLFKQDEANMELVEQLGVGVSVAYTNLTEVSLTGALQTVLYNADMPRRIREVSTEFRDRPLGAQETAIYWINYILRHNGGAQIKTRGIGFPQRQLHLFDLFVYYGLLAAFFGGVLVAAWFAIAWFRKRSQLEKAFNKMN